MNRERNNVLRFGRASLATLVAAALLAGCQGTSAPVGAQARIYGTEAGQALTAPSKAAPKAIVSQFLADRGLSEAAAELRIVRENHRARAGLVHLRLQQELDGLRVVGGYVKATVNDRGELLHLIENLAPVADKNVPAPTVTESEALNAALVKLDYPLGKALTSLGREGNVTAFAGGAFFHAAPTVERVVHDTNGRLEAGFVVTTWTQKTNRLHETLVDGAGRVVSVESRTQGDSYNVFTEDPLKGPQAVVAGPGAGNAESPSGWLSGSQTTINIKGNNVNAYLDTDANNAADLGGTAVTDGNFLAAADLNQAPSTATNRAVAVQNLFYLNNVVHDVLYRHGFIEAEGNFQTNNFGKGGRGNDPVNAEAQDGSGTDNANFATPRDGSSPRMQMYVWSGRGTHEVTVNGTTYPAEGAAFGPAFSTTGVTGPLGVMSPADGCTAAAPGSLSGQVAVVDRGACNFDLKAYNAQQAGATAVIIANHAAGGDDAFTMAAGTQAGITISSVMVGYTNGGLLKAAAGASANVRKKDPAPLQVDGDLDSDIVFHEYGHGLTWRMIGTMSGPLAGAIGEGASDVLAFLINGDDRIGEYSYSLAKGIRRYVYVGYPLTYGSIRTTATYTNEVHNDGEIYAGAMWRLKELYNAAGLSDDALLGDFVRGMNYTPAKPVFEHMRDGMLQQVAAAGTGAVRTCLIWRAFAQFGVGVGAKGAVKGSKVTVTESFTVPATCQ